MGLFIELRVRGQSGRAHRCQAVFEPFAELRAEGEARRPTLQSPTWPASPERPGGGNLHQSRHYSLYLALQLKARYEGIPTPVCAPTSRTLPWAPV
jgi:hypothetical protein